MPETVSHLETVLGNLKKHGWVVQYAETRGEGYMERVSEPSADVIEQLLGRGPVRINITDPTGRQSWADLDLSYSPPVSKEGPGLEVINLLCPLGDE